MFAPTVGNAEPAHQPGQARRVALVAGLVQQDERGSQDQPSTLSGSSQAVVPAWPRARPGSLDLCIADHGREPGHRDYHHGGRDPDRPVPAHWPAPDLVVRDRISELSRKQHG
jgi:hypothetical protein